MNTTVAPVETKNVVSVDILNLDVVGYGPQGKHTRREWRAECLENLLAGKEQFEAWQASWNDAIQKNLFDVSLSVITRYSDGTEMYIAHRANYRAYTLDFSGHTFENVFDVRGINFEPPIAFFGAQFLQNLDFVGVTYESNIYFDYAYFFKNVFFVIVKFKAIASFHQAYFNRLLHFSNVEFYERSIFKQVVFNGDAFFSSVKFLRNADFSFAAFEKQSNFYSNDISDSQYSFVSNGSEFRGMANFENAKFKNVGHFERANFKGEIPNFLGVDNTNTLLMFSGEEYFNKKDTTEDAVNRLAQLKRLADEQGQTDQALMFNALELNAKAKQPNSAIALKTITSLYKILSDYGRSFTRPILFYGLLICISFLFSYHYSTNLFEISVIHKNNCKSAAAEQKLDLSRERAAVEYALFRAGGVFDFTDTGKQNNAINCRLFEEPIEPPLMRAWGIFKGIASIALLFLAALGLRNKYRIK